MSLSLFLLLVAPSLLLNPTTSAATPLPIPPHLPLPSFSNRSSPSFLTSATDDNNCPTSSFCFPDFAFTIGNVSHKLGCWSCSHNGSCDAAWYEQPGVYCGTGTGSGTVYGQRQTFSYLAFCCPSATYTCTPGYAYTRDDATLSMKGYGCVKPEGERGLSAAGLVSLVLTLALLTGGLTILAFLLWRRRHPHSTIPLFQRSPYRQGGEEGVGGEGEEAEIIPPPGQPVVPAPWPGDLDDPAPPVPPRAAPQPFRLDQSVADPSAYQRMQ